MKQGGLAWKNYGEARCGFPHCAIYLRMYLGRNTITKASKMEALVTGCLLQLSKIMYSYSKILGWHPMLQPGSVKEVVVIRLQIIAICR